MIGKGAHLRAACGRWALPFCDMYHLRNGKGAHPRAAFWALGLRVEQLGSCCCRPTLLLLLGVLKEHFYFLLPCVNY